MSLVQVICHHAGRTIAGQDPRERTATDPSVINIYYIMIIIITMIIIIQIQTQLFQLFSLSASAGTRPGYLRHQVT